MYSDRHYTNRSTAVRKYPVREAVAAGHSREQRACSVREGKYLNAMLRLTANSVTQFEEDADELIQAVHGNHRKSARNLVQYLGMRSVDLRPIQGLLQRQGLSSLGRIESNAAASLRAVADAVEALHPGCGPNMPWIEPAVGFDEGRQLLGRNTEALLGPPNGQSSTRIMVTMPREAATNPGIARDLVAAGMNCARINCAHDDPVAWTAIAENVRAAAAIAGRHCSVLMDLAGPKLRTGVLEPGPRVIKLRPRKDLSGKVVKPFEVRLTSRDVPGRGVHLPVDGRWAARVPTGAPVRFRDARGKKRRLVIRSRSTRGLIASGDRTSYVKEGSRLRYVTKEGVRLDTTVFPLPAAQQAILLFFGDRILLTDDGVPGHDALRREDGTVISPARIACTLPEALASVEVGHSVYFDDGRIGGVVESRGQSSIVVRITHASPKGSKLRADKGINFPDSRLSVSGLTEKDRQDLAVVAAHADLVGLSFVESSSDVIELQRELIDRDAPHVGIVLKIESQRAFRHLPRLLLSAMRSYPVGVMIARGDLAVECGWERLAEVQEEILWLSEAAHLPVIWATQVLEGLAKTGNPSRSEITDAAMAQRADCVMLNKGDFIVEAAAALVDILSRMSTHQSKKTPMLRRLNVASDLASL